MIQEGHAALDGGGHAHLVLLHQQLDQIGFHVGIEQRVEDRTDATRRVEVLARCAVTVSGVVSKAPDVESSARWRLTPNRCEGVEEHHLRRSRDGEERAARVSANAVGQPRHR